MSQEIFSLQSPYHQMQQFCLSWAPVDAWIWHPTGMTSHYRCLLLSPSSPDHLFCSVYGWSLRSSFHRLCYPCSLQMPSFCVYQRKIAAVGTAFPMWEAGTDGIFWKATLSNLDFLDKEQGRAGHSRCPSGLSFFFFSFGSLLCLDAHPVTQPLQLASACPRCNTCLV